MIFKGRVGRVTLLFRSTLLTPQYNDVANVAIKQLSNQAIPNKGSTFLSQTQFFRKHYITFYSSLIQGKLCANA